MAHQWQKFDEEGIALAKQNTEAEKSARRDGVLLIAGRSVRMSSYGALTVVLSAKSGGITCIRRLAELAAEGGPLRCEGGATYEELRAVEERGAGVSEGRQRVCPPRRPRPLLRGWRRRPGGQRRGPTATGGRA